MIANFIISGVCLIVSIKLFLIYNNGIGLMHSIKKRFIYSLSLLIFLAFIVFLNKGFYANINRSNKHVINEIKKEYNDLDELMNTKYDNTKLIIQDNKSKINVLIQQLDN